MKQYAVYLRVSTGKQSNGLEAQERAARSFLKSKGIYHFALYKDENQSGAKSSRPRLDEMMRALRSGRHISVIVYSFSRFARSTKHLLETLEEFNQLGVAFISLTEQVDTSNPMGRAVFTIISALAQLERELVSERVKCGLINARAKGKRLGAPRRRNSELVRELAARDMSYREIARLSGSSIATISRVLNEDVPQSAKKAL